MLYPEPDSLDTIAVRMMTPLMPDSTNPDKLTNVTFSQFYDIKHHSPSYFKVFMAELVEGFERHEQDEWLKFSGVRWNKPHRQQYVDQVEDSGGQIGEGR